MIRRVLCKVGLHDRVYGPDGKWICVAPRCSHGKLTLGCRHFWRRHHPTLNIHACVPCRAEFARSHAQRGRVEQ